jgi:hypothetical protein
MTVNSLMNALPLNNIIRQDRICRKALPESEPQAKNDTTIICNFMLLYLGGNRCNCWARYGSSWNSALAIIDHRAWRWSTVLTSLWPFLTSQYRMDSNAEVWSIA